MFLDIQGTRSRRPVHRLSAEWYGYKIEIGMQAQNPAPLVRYRMIETIGRGGMGEVCLADDLLLHRRVALKFLTSAGESDALDRLLIEARAAAALDHPFICSIYEVTTLDGRPCIAMEYVRGETFERRLRRGAIGLADGLRAAEEIAEALEAAHKRRVIHGDLKPANVMLTEDEHIKVMDFGLATRLPVADEDADSAAARFVPRHVGVVRGTPAYMAPEQIRGAATDRRSDIFSFGILVYELLSGVNPFMRTAMDATLAAILGESTAGLHERVPAIPATVGAVVAQMLAKEPAARYQSFADVRRDLRRLTVDLSVPPAYAASVVVERVATDGSAALIGRDAERSLLLHSIKQAAAGQGTVVVLGGEGGIGKTRLAEEALIAARRIGCQTLVGRCDEQEGTPPLVPYIEVLEEASRLLPASTFRHAVEPSAAELAKLFPELFRLFPDMEPALELPPQLRQRFLFTNFREFLARCSRFAPLVVFLDDFQWADPSTLQLTQHLAQHLATLPIVIIAAHRDADSPDAPRRKSPTLLDRVRGQMRETRAPQSVKAALDQLVQQRQARAIALRPFSEAEVRSMLGLLAAKDPPATLVRTFVEHSGGNPFFIAELFRHLKDEGRLFDSRLHWRRGLELDEVEIPESVRFVLERRLQRVSGETQKVLNAAAVIGHHFELDLLEAVADVDDDALVSALDEAEQARILKGPAGRRDTTWRFTHRLLCQTLTSEIPQLRRQRLHMRVADSMTRLDAPARPYASEIAHHLYSAGRLADAGRTARALITAGELAHSVYATDEAIRHYRRALEVLRDSNGDQATELDVEERLADLLALVGEPTTAMEHYERLARAHAPAPASVDHARITRKMGTLYWHGGDRLQALASYRSALNALSGTAAHIETAHVCQELGLAAFRSGNNEEAIAWAERALQSGEAALSGAASVSPGSRKAATAAIAHAINTIGVALARSGQLDAARERIESSLAAARELGLLDVACRAYANLGVLYSTLEPRRAIDVSLTGLELASKIGAASLQSYIYANLAAAYCALTDRCEIEGLQAAQAAAALDRELGQLDHLAVPLIVMAQIYQCRGELEKAFDAYREALAVAEKIGEPQLILPCYDGLGTIHLDRGDKALASEYLQKARELCARSGLDPDSLLLLPFLC